MTPTTYLKTTDEAELIAAMPLFRHDNDWVSGYGSSDLLVIGTLYEGGTYDEQGEVITPPVALEGYHANLINRDNIEVPESLIIPEPQNPKYEYQK